MSANIGFILTEEEIACIRWHMGAFDDSKNWNKYNLAIQKYPNVLFYKGHATFLPHKGSVQAPIVS